MHRYAFFLDVDGTLIEVAPRPNEVRADPALLELLRSLRVRSDGAMALVSGRSIAALDVIMRPECFSVSGLHGFERRGANGLYAQRTLPRAEAIDEARLVMRELIATYPQLLLEDKRYALALHYRQAPHLKDIVTDKILAIAGLSAGGLRVQHGRMVVDVTPRGVSKASALAEFMREVPFKGRAPLYVGDDLTDESAFRWVNDAGGLSVAVHTRRPTAARVSLSSVAAVRTWLNCLIEDSR